MFIALFKHPLCNFKCFAIMFHYFQISHSDEKIDLLFSNFVLPLCTTGALLYVAVILEDVT